MPSREEKDRRRRLAARESDRRRLGSVPPSGDDDDWYWGNRLAACFEDLRAEFAGHHPPVVDCEVVPDFSGIRDGMVIWLICERKVDVELLKVAESALKQRLVHRMQARKFPESAVASLQVMYTSLEDIELGGGRFRYFR
jgi:hypothetical protein